MTLRRRCRTKGHRQSITLKPQTLFLPFTLFFAFLLRLPSLFEPYWYGDEGIYQVIGQALSSGRLLYAGIWDNKPPFLYLLYGVFNGDQFSMRAVSLLFMMAAIISFYFLSRELFKKPRVVNLTTGLFAFLFAIPLLEGNIANAENFMLFPIILAMLLAFRGHFIAAGLLLSTAFLFKIVAIFDFAALLTFLFIVSFPKKLKEWLREDFFLAAGFTLPIILTVFYFVSKGIFADFLTATFSQNVTYIGLQTALFIKLFFLAVFCFAVFFFKEKLKRQHLFIYIWFGFSLFNALFGARPWIHYLLTLLPAWCLFVGFIIENKKLRLINTVVLLVLFAIMSTNFWVYGKTIFYYGNFLGKVTGRITTEEYRGSFDWFVNRDYAVASYIIANSDKDDTIFVWGDNPQIYALSGRLPPGRYTVSYHVAFYPNALLETKEAIAQKKPKLILAVREDIPQVLLDLSYELKNEIKGVKIYERRN